MWTTLLIAFIVVGSLLVVLPLFKRKPTWIVASMEQLQVKLNALVDQKERALRRIKDLDLEKESGALTDAEYEQLRGEFIQDVVMVNRRLEEMQRGSDKKPAKSEKRTEVKGASQ